MASRDITLGFCDPPERTFLYVSQDETSDAAWYILVGDGDKSFIPSRGLTGYLRGIRTKMVNTRGQDKLKLDIFVYADRMYVLRSGVLTVFARNILLDLDTLTPDELQQPLVFCVTQGTREAKVVFGSLYLAESGKRIRAPWDATCKLAPIVKKLQTIVGEGEDEEEKEKASTVPLHGHIGQQGYLSPAQYTELLRIGALKGMDLDRVLAGSLPKYGARADSLMGKDAINYRQDLVAL